ncbi:MAG: endonuclease domain-containing protein [Proteobacteria bacterium]|nr:endonuclease domain-containing protein [Pseudomonadota bacterium]
MRESEKIATARTLRRRQTDAEKALWRLLRNRTFQGTKFRRQHAIGPYVADFVCLELKLVVELDGGQHAVNKTADDARTAKLQLQGFRVLRIWNNDMLTNPEGVLRLIEQGLRSPHPNPLPQAGEGGTRREAVGGGGAFIR